MIDRKPQRWGRVALDPNDICCEIYNPGTETITFESFHVNRQNHYFVHPKSHQLLGPIYWGRIECPPGDFCFLPHQYYRGSVPSGSQEITVVKNYGDSKFLGNKHPSPPESRPLMRVSKR